MKLGSVMKKKEEYSKLEPCHICGSYPQRFYRYAGRNPPKKYFWFECANREHFVMTSSSFDSVEAEKAWNDWQIEKKGWG